MREALLLAREAAADGEVPVGCVITLEDCIVCLLYTSDAADE